MPRWHVAAEPQQVVAAVCRCLDTHGWLVQRSFDLRTALERLPGWHCPHHGTSACACSLVVLLAWKPGCPPVPIQVEGQDRWTFVDIPGEAECPSSLYQFVEQAVLDVFLSAETHHKRREKMAAKDPVCGMMVEEDKAAATYEYKGKTYYFCAPGCKAAFEKDPEKYLKESGHSEGGHEHHHH